VKKYTKKNVKSIVPYSLQADNDTRVEVGSRLEKGLERYGHRL